MISTIKPLAGSLRAKTFAAAASFVIGQEKPRIIETGCFRGCKDDGQSTVILALLAKETGGSFVSYELHEHNIALAKALLAEHGLDQHATFTAGDSGTTLANARKHIALAYLDSYDFEPHKAIDAQAHQLVELGRILPKMANKSAILLDDCDLPYGGKAGLSCCVIELAGFKLTHSGYQKLYVR